MGIRRKQTQERQNERGGNETTIRGFLGPIPQSLFGPLASWRWVNSYISKSFSILFNLGGLLFFATNKPWLKQQVSAFWSHTVTRRHNTVCCTMGIPWVSLHRGCRAQRGLPLPVTLSARHTNGARPYSWTSGWSNAVCDQMLQIIKMAKSRSTQWKLEIVEQLEKEENVNLSCDMEQEDKRCKIWEKKNKSMCFVSPLSFSISLKN